MAEPEHVEPDQIELLLCEVEQHAITQLEVVRPCPFCHSMPPELKRLGTYWALQCSNVRCVFGRSNRFEDLGELIDKWNRRYERCLPPPPEAL